MQSLDLKTSFSSPQQWNSSPRSQFPSPTTRFLFVIPDLSCSSPIYCSPKTVPSFSNAGCRWDNFFFFGGQLAIGILAKFRPVRCQNRTGMAGILAYRPESRTLIQMLIRSCMPNYLIYICYRLALVCINV